MTKQFFLTRSDYSWLLSNLGYAYDVFLLGFLYYAVFLYLIRNGYLKMPCPENKERDILYTFSWMLLLWVDVTLTILWLEMDPPFKVI